MAGGVAPEAFNVALNVFFYAPLSSKFLNVCDSDCGGILQTAATALFQSRSIDKLVGIDKSGVATRSRQDPCTLSSSSFGGGITPPEICANE
jgi:hypothetical protein